MPDLLIVENDPSIGSALRRVLSAQGYAVGWETTGRDGLAAAARSEPDLVLVELGLPDLDGLELTRRLRHLVPGAVLVMLSAHKDEADVVAGLQAGADDCLTHPFRLAELVARLRAYLRRAQPVRAAKDVYEVGPLRVERVARRCTLGSVKVELPPREFDLMARLAASAGEAVRRETLMADVWHENSFGSTKTLDVHVAWLRRRLGDASVTAKVRTPVLTTLRGHGYRLERDT